MRTRHPLRQRSHGDRRRGVVILIVLSLLVMISLIALTFAISATQYRDMAKNSAKRNVTGDDPQRDLEAGMYQLLRDTRLRSALWGHSLLLDIYGSDGVTGRLISNGVAEAGTGQQFVRFDVQNDTPALSPFGRVISSVPDYYNGLVLTMLDGPARGKSVRIADYVPSDVSNPNTFIRVEAFDTDRSGPVFPQAGNRFLINGRPFNGTGAGFFPQSLGGTGNLDRETTINDSTGNSYQLPIALLPHYRAIFMTTSDFATNVEQGGSDESYDAVDFQNMFLGKFPATATTSNEITPSFHRPELIAYWRNYFQNQGVWGDAVLQRALLSKVCLRPLPVSMGGHHTNFNGSNPNFDMTGATPGSQWDVDSDGDGIRDAVWIDAGLPLKTSPDGRMYKPLLAFRVEDLDGKLSLNAHSNMTHLDPPNQVGPPGSPYNIIPSYSAQTQGYFAGGHGVTAFPNAMASVPMPRGSGFGPAGVYMGHLFNPVEYRNILTSRYGTDLSAGIPGPGLAGDDDRFSIFKSIGRPGNYATSIFTDSGWGSPPDVWDRDIWALDYRGQPLIQYYNALPLQTLDDPYEINLAGDGSEETGVGDQPYTLNELERLLRYFDHDGGKLPQRLLALAPNSLLNAANRRRFTTHSVHVPAPSATLPTELRSSGGALQGQLEFLLRLNSPPTPPNPPAPPAHMTIQDLLYARLLDGGVAPADVPAQAAMMLPFEMRRGQLFDINRHFGNGVDEGDPDATPDNPLEQAIGEQTWPNTGTNFDGIPFNHLNDNPQPGMPGNPVRVRQIFARHLYCLMMLLKDSSAGIEIDFDNDPSNNTPQETARGIAQWAVNVVDFRDADSIMTPFEYDIFPFDNNGWSVDDVVGTSTAPSPDDTAPHRGLVWGCERPEMLITESLAVHQRRTEDRDDETANPGETAGRTDDTANPDTDFDQRLRPRGSFFVELYNPWAGVSKLPSELYVGPPASAGVQLDRRAPLVAGGPLDGAPVWRLRIVAGASKLPTFDPDQTDPTAPDYVDPTEIERTVYFTGDPAATGATIPAPGPDHQNFWRDDSTITAISPLRPGHYAVIGSAGTNRGGGTFGSYETMMGRTTTAIEDGTGGLLEYDATRRIQLRPDGNPNVHQVRVLENQAAPVEPVPADIRPAIAIPIGEPRNLSITEPLTGYPEPNGPNGEIWNPAAADGEGAYEPPIDTPLDAATAGLMINGTDTATTVNFRTVHLQRLADPTLPFDEDANPYLTIDSKSVDVTVFNGIEDDSTDPSVTAGRINFASLQRGEQDATVPAPNIGYARNLWQHENIRPVPAADDTPEPGPTTHRFPYVLEHTLGYLNTKYGPAYDSTNQPGPGYEGAPYASGPSGPLGPARQNDQPFPWLGFHNRPFNTPLELMLVPRSRSSRLLYDWGTAFPVAPPAPPGNGPYTLRAGQYGHLLNFFQNEPDGADAPARLYRIFDYVETPSPFVGTERWYNPAVFATAGANVGAEEFRPPHNKLSRFRDPGRININTIFDEETWNGLIGGFRAMHPASNGGVSWWNKLERSRRGHFTAPGVAGAAIDFPSEFSNPFRSTDAGDLWPAGPIAELRAQRPAPTGTGPENVRDGLQAGLLRSDPDRAGEPLFRNIIGENADAYHQQNPVRNPYFAYQGISRLANMVSTHSNVFAVWITVGYFEVEPIQNNPALFPHYDPLIHSEGYQLGQEVGLDRGQVKRHRMFFIIDRSQPVAFEPGENHNVDRAVLLRRFIE